MDADSMPDVAAFRRAPRPPDPRPRAAIRGVGDTKPVALIVDDEPMIGAMMAMILDSQGWRTVVATAAEDAAALADDLALDLLVTDLKMSGMSGFDLATSLRERRPKLPVVLMSGSLEAAALELAPPFVFLQKPFGIDPLVGAIGSLFVDGSTQAPTTPTAGGWAASSR